MVRDAVIIGNGIVGASIAHELSSREGVRVTVLERDSAEPRGSTAFAPGFVGLYNDVPVLTDLARASAAAYDAHAGFARVGGFELATSPEAAREVERRVLAALDAGLEARLVDAADLPAAAPGFVDPARVVAAAHFAQDGAADPIRLAGSLRAAAAARGAVFVPGAEVVGIDPADGHHVVRTAGGGSFAADDVILAVGVWGPTVSPLVGLQLPIVPVAHPYVYSGAMPFLSGGPFVRWPEHHVYARAHGDRLGVGTYDHVPVPVGQPTLGSGAGLEWDPGFEDSLDRAQALLREEARFVPERRINGVFAMTPDNLPFIGAHPSLDGVWIAQAVWVTSAAGAAQTLVRAMLDGVQPPSEFAVDRFRNRASDELRTAALRLYREIYGNDVA